MHSQDSAADLIAQEKERVQQLVGLESTEDAVFNDAGWDSRVYIIGSGKFVFRFPRSAASQQQYEKEIAACKIARSLRCDVQLPEVVWEHPDHHFIGFRGIVGTTLDHVVARLDESAKVEIGRVLGTFLKQFHQCHLDGARMMSAQHELEEIHHKYELGLPLLQQCLTAAEHSQLQRLVREELPATFASLSEEVVLCHGDLGYWNIVYGEASRIGIIDFGDVGYYDQSRDFIGFEDQSILEAALQIYGDNLILRQKIALRKRILPVLELPFYIGKHDQAGIEKTLLRIRANLAAL